MRPPERQPDRGASPDGASGASGAEDPLLISHAQRIRANAFLRAIYQDVYARLLAEVPEDQFPRALEIGSGGGFLKQHASHVTTTDCVAGPGIEHVVDACRLERSFDAGALDAIVGFDVFHHLPDVVGSSKGPS